MLEEYYFRKAPHEYMNICNFDLLIFNYLHNLDLCESIVLEIGSGYGRYTKALSQLSKKVIATEPNDYMHSVLQKNFSKTEKVQVMNRSIESLSNLNFQDTIDYIFMFHVLHHLNLNFFISIKKLITKLDAKLIVIEPNHFNPLFFFQIFLTKDMKYHEEKRMMIDNSSYLLKHCFNNGYVSIRKYLGYFPPSVTKILSRFSSIFVSSKAMTIKIKNPFSAYSVLEIKKA